MISPSCSQLKNLGLLSHHITTRPAIRQKFSGAVSQCNGRSADTRANGWWSLVSFHKRNKRIYITIM